jgi:formyltetrahydrofolate hydrolase
MALEQETALYQAKRDELLRRCPGQFVLIHDSRLLGTFGSFEQAFEAGIQHVGNAPFLIQQIVDQAPEVQFPALAVGVISARP